MGSKRKLEHQSSYQTKQTLKKITRHKEGHYIMINESIQEEDITIISIYSSNIGMHQYIKQIVTDIKREIDSITIIVGGLNTPLTPMDRSSKKLIRKHKS